MPCARSVLLILVLLAGSLSPPGLSAQARSNGPPPERDQNFHLEQNYPNPANPETWIPFTLDESLFENGDSVVVTIRIFNPLRQVVSIPMDMDHASGDRVRILGLVYREPGRKVAYWDGNDIAGRQVASGVYYAQLAINNAPRARTLKLSVLNPRRRRGIFPW
jgi:hypothetical protein